MGERERVNVEHSTVGWVRTYVGARALAPRKRASERARERERERESHAYEKP
jgi:hypothetical protein